MKVIKTKLEKTFYKHQCKSMQNIMTKKNTHEMKAIEFMLKIQRN